MGGRETEHLRVSLPLQLLDHLGLEQCPSNGNVGILVALERDELTEPRTIHTIKNHNAIVVVPVCGRSCRHSQSAYNTATVGGIAQVNGDPLENGIALEDEREGGSPTCVAVGNAVRATTTAPVEEDTSVGSRGIHVLTKIARTPSQGGAASALLLTRRVRAIAKGGLWLEVVTQWHCLQQGGVDWGKETEQLGVSNKLAAVTG